MKKVILSMAIALTAVTGAFAQKQQGGEKNLEVNFAPLGGSPIGIDGIRLRLFNTDGTGAIRVRLGLGGTNDKTVISQPVADPKAIELFKTEKSFNVSIRPGYEKHFEGTERLSPYVGAELIFAMGSETLIKEYHMSGKPEDAPWEITRKRGTTTLGINAVAGLDYYIANNLYLGAEIGFGWQNKRTKDQETEVSDEKEWLKGVQPDTDFSQLYRDNNGTPLNLDDDKVGMTQMLGDGKSYKNSGWGPNYQATLRLGWLF